MKCFAVLAMAVLAAAAFAADKKTYRYNCKGGAFTLTAAVDSSGRWSKAEPVVLQIDSEPPQTLVADPDAPDADSFKNQDYEFYALKTFITLTRRSDGVVVKTYNGCRAEWPGERKLSSDHRIARGNGVAIL